VIVTDSANHIVFESGALREDGSIVGNVNDDDPSRFEPHLREITRPDQVEIFEPILGDAHGHVTTGLLQTVSYLKDNRLLPEGFDKATATPDIAVHGNAASDPDFVGGGSRIRYAVPTDSAAGPLHIKVELMYQPIGFRRAAEPQRILHYYQADSARTAALLAQADATR
jgi:hypothetical protein